MIPGFANAAFSPLPERRNLQISKWPELVGLAQRVGADDRDGACPLQLQLSLNRLEEWGAGGRKKS